MKVIFKPVVGQCCWQFNNKKLNKFRFGKSTIELVNFLSLVFSAQFFFVLPVRSRSRARIDEDKNKSRSNAGLKRVFLDSLRFLSSEQKNEHGNHVNCWMLNSKLTGVTDWIYGWNEWWRMMPYKSLANKFQRPSVRSFHTRLHISAFRRSILL